MRVKCRADGECRRTKNVVCGASIAPAFERRQDDIDSSDSSFQGRIRLRRFFYLIRTYTQVVEYLDSASGSSLGLENIAALTAYLGNPQQRLKFLHIAGTNGKGSVLAYLSTVLSLCGYRTGRYSSPAVFDRLETVCVNNRPVCKEEYAHAVDEVAAAVARMTADGLRTPTRFEMETAAALAIFDRHACDVVVWETGLGGRLDATNVVDNTEAAIFTSISLDHVGVLGDTIAQIAREKAGIIKKGCVVISAPQQDEAAEAIAAIAAERGCQLYFARQGKSVSADAEGQTIRIGDIAYDTTLAGECQCINLAVAIETLRALRARGWNIPQERIQEGISRTQWGGRMEKLGNRPVFIIDGAHNPAAARMLAATLKSRYAGKRIVYLLGIFRDKDYDGILDETIPFCEYVVTFDWDHERALSGSTLAKLALKKGANAEYVSDAEQAMRRSIELAGTDGTVAAFGSLSHLNQLKKCYRRLCSV